MNPMTPPHDAAGTTPLGATMGTTDSVQQDMFTVLHGQPAPVVTRWSYDAADPFADWTAFGYSDARAPRSADDRRSNEPGHGTRDDCGTPLERERFELLGPVEASEIAACDLDELARLLGRPE